jgi:hypothetical protein
MSTSICDGAIFFEPTLNSLLSYRKAMLEQLMTIEEVRLVPEDERGRYPL